MDYTDHLNLQLPDFETDLADIRVINSNMEILDGAVGNIETVVSSHLAESATQAHLPQNVGLGNVDNVKQASKTEFDEHNNDATRHVTSVERTKWNTVDNKVDKVEGKELSTNDYTTAEKNKLAGIEAGANNYTHPASHPASMITESSNKRFVSDAEKSTWNSKSDTDTVTTINGKTGTILKADIVALGIPSQDTTYSEITTGEIDTGTASTPRTITARRLKYLLDKIVALFPSKTSELTNDSGFLTSVSKEDVGLGNVTNDKQMPISGGVLENYREKLMSLSGTSVTINLNNGNVFTHTLSGNTTYTISNAVSGQAHSFTLIITQTATVRTITFPASVKWQGGEIPDMSTANKTYVLTFVTINGGTTWLGMFGGEF